MIQRINSNTGEILLRLSTHEIKSMPLTKGTIVFNTTLDKIVWCNGSTWEEVGAGGGTSEQLSWLQAVDVMAESFPSPIVDDIRYYIGSNDPWTGTAWEGHQLSIGTYDGATWTFVDLVAWDTFFLIPFNFYATFDGTDLGAMNPYLGVGTLAYQSFLEFDENQVVSYEGILYKSLADSNSGNQPDTSPLSWTDITAGGAPVTIDPILQDYSASYTYAIEDIVQYEGTIYYSLIGSNTGNHPTTSRSSWSVKSIGQWSNLTAYSTNTIVFNLGVTYSAKSLNTGNTPTVGGDAYWTDLSAGGSATIDAIPIYSASVTYAKGDHVMKAFVMYSSTGGGNIGNNPQTDRTNWTTIGIWEYSPNQYYIVNNFVYYNAFLYRSKKTQNGNGPQLLSDINWELIQSASQKSLSLSIEVAEDGSVPPQATEKFRPVINSSVAISSMLYQAGTGLVRVVFDTVGDASTMLLGQYLNIVSSTNASNNGEYEIRVLNASYVDIYNPNRTTADDDESSSPATCEWKSIAVARIRRFASVASEAVEQSVVFQAHLPADYTPGSSLSFENRCIAPDGGDVGSTQASLECRVCVVNLNAGADFNDAVWTVFKPMRPWIGAGDVGKMDLIGTSSTALAIPASVAGDMLMIEVKRKTGDTLTKDIGILGIEVLYA